MESSANIDDLLHCARTERAELGLTTRCNLKCGYCASNLPGYVAADFAFASKMPELIREFKSRNLEQLGVSDHGETTMLAGWDRICGDLLAAGFPLEIVSNFARVFRPEEARLLARFRQIAISCDAVDPALFKRLRGGADFRNLLLNMANIRAAADRDGRPQPQMTWCCTVSDQNLFHLEDLAHFGLAMGVGIFVFINLIEYPEITASPVGHIYHLEPDRLRRALDLFERVREIITARGAVCYYEAGLLDSVRAKLAASETGAAPGEEDASAFRFRRVYSAAGEGSRTRDCLDPWQYFIIRASGDVAYCCKSLESIGSVLERPLGEILNGPEIKRVRRGILTGDLVEECRKCVTAPWTTPEAVQRKVAAYLAHDPRGASPEPVGAGAGPAIRPALSHLERKVALRDQRINYFATNFWVRCLAKLGLVKIEPLE